MTSAQLRNLITLSNAALRGEPIQAPPEAMAALWQDVLAGIAYAAEMDKPKPATDGADKKAIP